ncbi:hypothetical protein NQ176_g3716 [Zarea fungicola]|uniref:Uncharacterized protein n=1 Tax=Zarea fungicola TaxID=93591 RepID=A0ACC1NI81_9HYPO|nr:hypothetical protein NQ176_g3716 [Lecanicillium fungicola]
MSETFDLFPLLPSELRLRTWQLSIRDTGLAGVNYCDLGLKRSRAIEECIFIPPNTRFPNALSPSTCKTLHVKGCTACIDKGSRGCFHGNTSSYLVDSGLWDACKESRQVMLEKFGRLCKRMPPAAGDVSSADATFAFQLGNGGVRHATVLYGRDLFIISPLDLYHAVKTDPFVNWCFGSTHRCPALGDLRYFGVPLDLGWDDRQYSFVKASLCFIISDRKSDMTVYLIDYKLQRRDRRLSPSEARPPQHDARVFHASNGKFIEVLDLEDWNDGFDDNYTRDGPPGIFGRLTLRYVLFDLLYKRWQPRLKVGLLAWESN